ncbi:MAG: von Willebrand factor type A domain-containing protein, partial [Planctomycetaceae bacterium]|nr:von Willebrand factor type A domain-containing protein [Planctomycetaceae bacterium]
YITDPLRAAGAEHKGVPGHDAASGTESMLSELTTPEIGPVSGLAITDGGDQPSGAANADNEFARIAGPIVQSLGGAVTPETESASGLQAGDGLALHYESEWKWGRQSESQGDPAVALNQSPIIEGSNDKANVTRNRESQTVDPAMDRFRFDSGKQSNTSGSPATSHFNSDGEQPGVGQYNFQVIPQTEANSSQEERSTVRAIELQHGSPAELLSRLGDTFSRGEAAMENEPSPHPFAVDASEVDAEKKDVVEYLGRAGGPTESIGAEPQVVIPSFSGTTAIPDLQQQPEAQPHLFFTWRSPADFGVAEAEELKPVLPEALIAEEKAKLEQQIQQNERIRERAKGLSTLNAIDQTIASSIHDYALLGATSWSELAARRDGSTKVPTSALSKATSVASLSEKTAAEDAFSTFSLHVSDVSFKLALAALGKGEWPEAAKVRIEEFVNAFDYGDPMPANGEKVACAIEQSIHPFVQQRNLLRVSMRTAAAGRASQTPLRLTFVLDNSGSMERIDRQQTVRRAFAMLAQQLTPVDQVTLISFARQPRLLADKVAGADAGKLVGLIDELPSEGGTNIEAALQLAFEKAREQQTSSAQNRIILLTDGAVNLGNANPASLSQMVTAMRNSGIAFDAAGISADGLNDEVLEALARQGDGRYYLLDSLEAADDGFAKQIAGALRPSAKNVKVQVEFNPKRVGRYKLLGFEKHILKKEDFRNDKVDAAEMAAAEAGVAMYQFEALPDGEGDVGSVSVRFQDLSTGEMVENRWPIPYEADASRPDQAAGSLRVATSAAMLAAKLRGEPLGESVDLQVLSGLLSGLPEPFRNDTRVLQLQQMIEQARQLSRK